MSTKKSLRTIKIMLPMALLVVSAAFFAFKAGNNNINPQEPKTTTTLHFKYQLTTYAALQVSSQNNWELINSAVACEQDTDEKACSFSISVPEDDVALYLNGTKPSSKVFIEVAPGSSNYFVSEVRENTSNGRVIAASIENVRE